LNIDDDLQLCDCPGLVFPSFANSSSEMMTCGVLPIDKMRDYIGPMGLILGKVPKEVLEAHYKIILPPRHNKKLYTVSTFCSTFAAKKGWFTGRSLPNEF
jgi:large subunit GTPase 1